MIDNSADLPQTLIKLEQLRIRSDLKSHRLLARSIGLLEEASTDKSA